MGHLLCGLSDNHLEELASGNSTKETLLTLVGSLETCPNDRALEIFADLVS